MGGAATSIVRRAENGDPRAGKLFYAAILTDRECDLGSIGVDGKRVYSINCLDIGALVSDYPRVGAIKLLRKNVAPYHRVLREAAERFTTLPARFGQIARDDGEVGIALRRNYQRIRREAARLDGKVEMGLRVRWQVADVFEYLLERDAELRARRDLLLTKHRSLDRLARIELGGYVYERLNRARREVTDRILAALPEGEARLDGLSDDNMVLNAALLIRKGARRALDDAVSALASSLGDEYGVALDGPWPPFSFVDRVQLDLSQP